MTEKFPQINDRQQTTDQGNLDKCSLTPNQQQKPYT